MKRHVKKIWSMDQELVATSALKVMQVKARRYSNGRALKSRQSMELATPEEMTNIYFIEDMHLELQRIAQSLGGPEALRVISKTDWLAAVVRDTARAFDLLARQAESLRQIGDPAKDSGGANHE